MVQDYADVCDVLAEHMGLERRPPEDMNSLDRRALQVRVKARIQLLAQTLQHDLKKPDPTATPNAFTNQLNAELQRVRVELCENENLLRHIEEVDLEHKARAEANPTYHWQSTDSSDDSHRSKSRNVASPTFHYKDHDSDDDGNMSNARKSG